MYMTIIVTTSELMYSSLPYPSGWSFVPLLPATYDDRSVSSEDTMSESELTPSSMTAWARATAPAAILKTASSRFIAIPSMLYFIMIRFLSLVF